MALAGAIAAGAGIGRWRILGLDREATATLVIGLLLMASLIAVLAKLRAWRLPGWTAAGVGVMAVLSLIGGAAWYASAGGFGQLASLTANLPLIGAGKSVEGRAYASGPDALRIGNVTVRLGDIEAPENDQRCGGGASKWRCAQVAESVLSRLVNGRKVSCSLGGSDEAGRQLGQCSVGQKDVAAELVRQGYVFADNSFLARYASEEREARAAKAGLWAGEAERPADFRAKRWEEAKRRAPEGCPIKGQVSGASRVLRAAVVGRLRARAGAESARRALVLLRAGGRRSRLQGRAARMRLPVIPEAMRARRQRFDPGTREDSTRSRGPGRASPAAQLPG